MRLLVSTNGVSILLDFLWNTYYICILHITFSVENILHITLQNILHITELFYLLLKSFKKYITVNFYVILSQGPCSSSLSCSNFSLCAVKMSTVTYILKSLFALLFFFLLILQWLRLVVQLLRVFFYERELNFI